MDDIIDLSMCNLYSITTKQAAIAALFRVINRHVGNLAPMPDVFQDYPGDGGAESRDRARDGIDALGHALVPSRSRRLDLKK